MAERQDLIKQLTKLEAQLKSLYGETYTGALKITEVKKAIENGGEFTWSGNPAATRKLDSQLKALAAQTQIVVKSGINQAWTKGEEKVTTSLYAAFGKTSKEKEAVKTISERALALHRKEGMNAEAFANEKRGGLNISSRIWNLAGNAKKELEIIIQNGILEGKSADDLTKELSGYLNEPNKLYRRVKNKETGQLEWSKAAKKYNPGQGVYRSSYKNALRLARTEINAAYRRAEWEGYQKNPLITGYRIELSNNHTTMVKGRPVPLTDICDEMAGQYPKTFLWTGWHPQCRCRMIPITISDKDFAKRMKALAKGKLDEWKPEYTVTEPPKALTDWVNNNRERVEKGKAVPYWIKDNYTNGNIAAGLNNNIQNLKDIVKQAQQITTPSEENTPEALKKGSPYFKGKDIELENGFFKLIDPDKPIGLNIVPRFRSGSCYDPGAKTVNIVDNERLTRSDWYRKGIIYHEFGHGIDWQRGLRFDMKTTETLTRWRKILNTSKTRTYYEKYYDFEKRAYSYRSVTRKISDISYIDNRLSELERRIYNTDKATFTRLGVSKGDLMEQILAVRDSIKAINPAYGEGHTNSYYKRSGARGAEFIAHCFENEFAGNPIFKKYLPDLYEEMKAIIKELK